MLKEPFVDVFLVYENVAMVNGALPPTGIGLYEILADKCLPFVTSFDIVAIHLEGQVSLTRSLHQQVHFGLARPAILKLCKYVVGLVYPAITFWPRSGYMCLKSTRLSMGM